jgi:hypothetical protein
VVGEAWRRQVEFAGFDTSRQFDVQFGQRSFGPEQNLQPR